MNFYMILPSNSSHTFEDNVANSYTIGLEKHIELVGKWEVALTEYSFENPPKIIDMKKKLLMKPVLL